MCFYVHAKQDSTEIELDYFVRWLKACMKEASLQHLTSAIVILEIIDKQCRGKLRNIYAISFIIQPTQIRQCHRWYYVAA